MGIFLLASLVGLLAGLRAFIAPLLVSWLAYLGWVDLSGTWLAFFGSAWTRWILLALAIGELVTDQLPTTPSRTIPVQFGTRIVFGAISGAAVGAYGGTNDRGMLAGLVAGAIGAVIGTLGGKRFRERLSSALGKDRPAAFVEDGIAVGGALLIGVAVLL